MATRFVWDADSVGMSGQALAPQVVMVQTTLKLLAFADGQDDLVTLHGVAPQGLTGALSLVAYGWMETGTTGTLGLRAEVEAVTPGDALNRNTTRSFDSINYATSATVPGTAGFEFATTISLTANDSMAAADDFIIRFGRDGDGTGTTDSVTGRWLMSRVELRDAA